MTYSQQWDLSNIFPSIDSKELTQHYEDLKQDTASFAQELANVTEPFDLKLINNLIQTAQAIAANIHSAGFYIAALSSVDYGNPLYKQHEDFLAKINLKYVDSFNKLIKIFAKLTEEQFNELLLLEDNKEINFYLHELKKEASRLLADDKESLINDLALDGSKAWSNHYDSIVSTLNLTYQDENGQDQTISAGQALNMLDGHPNPQVRKNIMAAYEEMWTKVENITSDTINHLAGFRLTDQKAHGYNDHLEVPLELNRMSKETLDAMWQVVADNQPMFQEFFNYKKKLLNLDTLGWQDQDAPLSQLSESKSEKTYTQAANFIEENFAKFSPKMADFAKYAFENNWIESENRPGKQPGGYMEYVPKTGESRIFMTYTGSTTDLYTIAHELGHAFHSGVLNKYPYWRENYSMNVAETASTFAELIVADADLANAKDDLEKLISLDTKMSNPVAMFLNIRARFLFEDSFYKARKEKILTADELNELMVEAQKTAFAGILDAYHPHFWSSKLHFYGYEVPFYNFPYTFGFLFSLSIYAQAKKEIANGINFEDKYISLLQDTANMSTEDLAKKHLNADITKPEFWQAGADLVKQDIDEFIALAKKVLANK